MTIPPNTLPPMMADDQTRSQNSGGFWKSAGEVFRNGIKLGFMMPVAGAVKDTAGPVMAATADFVATHPYGVAAAAGTAYTANKVHGYYEHQRDIRDHRQYEGDCQVFDGSDDEYGDDQQEFYSNIETRLERMHRHDPQRAERERRKYVQFRQQHACRDSDIDDFGHRFRPPSPPPAFWEQAATRINHGTRRFMGEDVDSFQETREAKRERERAHRERWGFQESVDFEFKPGQRRDSLF